MPIRMDIGEWWHDVLTDDEIRKIEASQKAQIMQIENEKALNQQILALWKDLSDKFAAPGAAEPTAGGGTTTVEMPPELQQMIDLYQPGGQYGAGAKAEIERGGQQALASGQLGMASTGMSSGTNAAALGARVGADMALSKAKVEDERVNALGGALGATGSAKLGASMQAQQLTSAADIAYMQAQAANQRQLMASMAALRPNFV